MLLGGNPRWSVPSVRHRATEALPISIVAPTFVVMQFDREGNVTSFEKKKTELCQELSLQARDLRFQHSTSLTARNNCIIIRMETLRAVVTPQCLLVLDFRGLGLERWLVLELAQQLASNTNSLPFEFRALEAILQHRVNALQGRLNEVQPVILDTLESLVDPKLLSADRTKLHILLQNSKSLSELETDIRVFKDSMLKILDEEEIIEELCLTKWTDPTALYVYILHERTHIYRMIYTVFIYIYMSICLFVKVKRAVWVLTTLMRWSYYWRTTTCRLRSSATIPESSKD